jgi:branched-chain amino acid aminotransferase
MTDLWLETPSGEHWHSADAPLISVNDRGLAYGDGLFETIRILHSTPLFLARHLQRLLTGLHQLNFPVPWDGDALTERCRAVIAHTATAEGVLKITVTRGVGPRGFAPPPEAQATLILQAIQTPQGLPNHSLTAITAPWKIDPASPLCYVKHLSALDKVLAKQQARQAGADDAVFVNLHGHLTETTSWNLFVARAGQIFTPALRCGLLPGITRAVLLETYPIIENELPLEALTRAAEAFLTNAVSGVQPLVRVEGQRIGTGAPGPITAAVQAHYEQLIQAEIGRKET